MTTTIIKNPPSGHLFRVFTNLGPYFRRLKSTETYFFFDSLEICLDAEEYPSERLFYGWNVEVTRKADIFSFNRHDGLFNIESEWVNAELSKSEQKKIDGSFNLFITRLQMLIKLETGCSLVDVAVDVPVLEEA